jgi:Thioredoxin like C-terminal domain
MGTLDKLHLASEGRVPPLVRLNEAGGSLAHRLRARDVNLVMGPADRRQPVRFQVRIDGGRPGPARGVDVDERGEGAAHDRRQYQLVCQPEEVDEHTFEITFLDPRVEAYVFTLGWSERRSR